MSVIIRNMEMPKDGTFNIVHIYSDGHVSMPYWGKGMQIVNGITAVPVPPHGDLIDREKLYEQTANWEAQALDQTLRYRPEEDRDEWRWWSAVLKERSAFKFDVADAPTVIPAEE